MKRSEVNAIMEKANAFIRSHGWRLPPFAYWSPQEFQARADEAREIIDARLGWDITDFGRGDFASHGLFLFTTRNGRPENLKRGEGVVYAEKIMVTRENQHCPTHRHDIKVEDIINRGGGTLAIELHMRRQDGAVDETGGVTVTSDGIERTLPAGGVLRLDPGESVTLHPHHWHAFWGEGGDVLVGEVSTVNDDETDNIFHEDVGRFSQVEEDEPPRHLLVSDYPAWLPR